MTFFEIFSSLNCLYLVKSLTQKLMQTSESKRWASSASSNYLKFIISNLSIPAVLYRVYTVRSMKLTSCSIVEVHTVANGTSKNGCIEKSQKITICKLVITPKNRIVIKNGDCKKRETTNHHVLQWVLLKYITAYSSTSMNARDSKTEEYIKVQRNTIP